MITHRDIPNDTGTFVFRHDTRVGTGMSRLDARYIEAGARSDCLDCGGEGGDPEFVT